MSKNDNIVWKIVLSLFDIVIANIPLIISYGCYNFLDPSGFWQKSLVIIASLIFLGGFQIWFWIFFGAALIAIWES